MHGVRIINTVDDGFKTWNIDASPNRGWDRRDLSDPRLHSLGKHLYLATSTLQPLPCNLYL